MIRSIAAGLALALAGAAAPAQNIMTGDPLVAIRTELLANAAKAANGSAVKIFTQSPAFIGEFVGRMHTGEVEEHQLWTDEIVVREGEVELVTGGTIEGRHPSGPSGEFRGSALVGGTSRRVHPGDIIEVPAGMLHWIKVLPGGPTVMLVYKVHVAP